MLEKKSRIIFPDMWTLYEIQILMYINKVLLEHIMQCLCDCFLTTTSKLSSCNRIISCDSDHMACKYKIFTIWSFTEPAADPALNHSQPSCTLESPEKFYKILVPRFHLLRFWYNWSVIQSSGSLTFKHVLSVLIKYSKKQANLPKLFCV